jgi:alpha-1,2-mannosyltransferase
VKTFRARSRPAVTAPVPGDRRGSRAVGWIIVVTSLLALGLRLYELSRPGYLTGVSEYDDGTDFGSAVRLIHGALPYHDFIMVQPPGITLLMAPVALATKSAGTAVGMTVARIVTAVAGAAAVPLAGLLVRHRGALAVIATCGTLAIFPDSLLAARTVLLEPWLVLFCLLGALAVFDGDRLANHRRLLLGGLAFGFAGAVKVWAIIPVLVILAITIRRRRSAARFAAGVALGFGLPVLPFALSAPSIFYRSVIIAQLVRSDATRITQGYRLQNILGLNNLSQMGTPALITFGVVVVVIVAAASVAAARLAGKPPPLEVFATATCVLVVISFLWPADFYYHYAAFLAPFAAMTIALPISRLIAALPVADATGPGPAWLQRRATLARRAATTVAALAIAGLTVSQVTTEYQMASQVPAAEISTAARLIPPGACVATDQVSYTIAINRFVSTAPGCSLMVDGIGSDYALSRGHNGLTRAGSTPAVEALWMSAFRAAQYLFLTSEADRRIPWTPRLLVYFDSHFVPLMKGPDWLYIRTR